MSILLKIIVTIKSCFLASPIFFNNFIILAVARGKTIASINRLLLSFSETHLEPHLDGFRLALNTPLVFTSTTVSEKV